MTVPSSTPEDILERICGENLAVYRESPGRLQEDVSQEAQVAHDYRGRLVYELLQNADDSMAGIAGTDDRVLFKLTDSELWVANTGRAFTEADVRGLCGLGASSKTAAGGPKRASIGHKGLGFKSTLEITDAPEAYSESVAFRLGKEAARKQVAELWSHHHRGGVRDVPAMRFPSSIEHEDSTWHELRSDGFRTAFRFPFHERITKQQRAALARQLLTLPMTSVLFLKHLEEVVIEVSTSTEDSDRQWLLERHLVSTAGVERCSGLDQSGLYRVDLVNKDGDGDRYWVAHNGEVSIGNHRDGLSGPAWDGVNVTEVSVAVRDADDPYVEPSSRRFHVFLPTQEPSGCSLLVNGAFTTDLSRQRVQVADSTADYNGYLVRQAADTFVQHLLPHLLDRGGLHYVLRVLDRSGSESGPAAALLSDALAALLLSTPLFPATGEMLTLGEVALPTPLLGADGPSFAELLATHSQVAGRRFPDPEYCDGELTAVCADYGATTLTAAESLQALARHADSSKSALRRGPDLRYRVDPVLDLCTLMWERADAHERRELQDIAPIEQVFPIGEDDDGTVIRIALGEESAFYPPASSAGELPLRRIRFLAHAVCWGNVGRREQRSVLEGPMKAWDALFSIKDFRFEEVMRAAVLPGLTRAGGADAELRKANRSIEVLATICRLAGKTTKADHPLPMGRLGSDRAFFNLSRLEVPCRTDRDGKTTWAPAYRVYFGRDWIGDDSVEGIVNAMEEAGETLEVRFLAAPEAFAAFSQVIGVNAAEGDAEQGQLNQDEDEVDLEDDTDEALETTVDDRWRNFFAWLGVSRGLRLVHFHDVDDTGTSWTSTKDLGLPGGWAFAGLDGPWSTYRSDLIGSLESDPRWDSTDHYLYQVHNLDRLDEIVKVARLKNNNVSTTLFEHLVRNWSYYSPHVQAKLALVGSGARPSARTRPHATPNEIAASGPNFWLYRLRDHPICPTSHGPRRPNQTWRRTDELTRRLGRSERDAGDFLPVLAQPDGVPATSLRACLDELQVRGELTPAAFTIDDARDLCVRMSQIYAGGVSEQLARKELRPIYRELFELLARTRISEKKPLAEVPLAASTARGIEFRPAQEILYASVSGSRERSGVQDRVPIFVLEAESGAYRPMREIFGALLLEKALEWSVQPGEPALDDSDLETFRQGLWDLLPPLLARLSADRADRRHHKRVLTNFTRRVQPVASLAMSCAFRGADLGSIPQRAYHVGQSVDGDIQGFIVWTGPAWPPVPEDAQALAMALAEALEVNTVETFLSFIQASPEMRRQLLDLAGASGKWREVTEELENTDSDLLTGDREGSTEEGPAIYTDGESTEAETGERPSAPSGAAQAIPRIPLHSFDDLLIDGDVIKVKGTGPRIPATSNALAGGADGNSDSGSSSRGAPRAAQGTDLTELDRLGMRVTFAFEQRRFPGRSTAVLPSDEALPDAEVLIVDVSSPAMIKDAIAQSPAVESAFETLRQQGISDLYPGFDILTIDGTEIDRMIELKSSLYDAQVQAMSWNEWKTAGGDARHHFWLYLVGNLRADLRNAAPFVRAVQDPFGTIASSKSDDVIRKRTVQLRVREFAAADELQLSLRKTAKGDA